MRADAAPAVGWLLAAALGLAGCSAQAGSTTASCQGRTTTIAGTSGADKLTGTPGPDVIAGGAGDDVISGLGGDDLLCGGPGADRVLGGAGDDVVDGGEDKRYAVDTESYEWQGDDLEGGPGDDTLVTGPHEGHAAVDTVSFRAAATGVTVDLAAGTATGEGRDEIRGDVRVLVGTRHADRLLGSEAGEEIYGGRGGDRIAGRGGNDRLDAARTPVLGDEPDREETDRDRNLIDGGPGHDEITGSLGDDTLAGGAGPDSLDGHGGRDRVVGGAGDDTLYDWVVPRGRFGTRRQVLDGGAGTDEVSVLLQRARLVEPVGDSVHGRGTGRGVIDLGAGLLRGRVDALSYALTIRAFENVATPYGTWTVIGTDGANRVETTDESRPVRIFARAGDDELFGSFRGDLLDGGAGRDVAAGYVGRDRYVDVEKRLR